MSLERVLKLDTVMSWWWLGLFACLVTSIPVGTVVSEVRRLTAWGRTPSIGDQAGHCNSWGRQEGPYFHICDDSSCWDLIPLVSRSAGLSDVRPHFQFVSVVSSLISLTRLAANGLNSLKLRSQYRQSCCQTIDKLCSNEADLGGMRQGQQRSQLQSTLVVAGLVPSLVQFAILPSRRRSNFLVRNWDRQQFHKP